MSTSLMKAATTGNVVALETALECTATNIDAVDQNGKTALMIAAQNGVVELVCALCNAGADTTLTDGDGLTAEKIAIQSGHELCAARLAKEQAKRNELMALIGLGASSALPSRQSNPSDVIMARLLAEAGLPKGPAESPF